MLAAAAFLLLAVPAMASEYPERECCDPVEPPPVSASGTPYYTAAAGHPKVEGTPALASENSAALDVRRGTCLLLASSHHNIMVYIIIPTFVITFV